MSNTCMVRSGEGRSRALVLVRAIVVIACIAVTFRGVRLALKRQAAIARKRIGKPLGEISLDADRVWRKKLTGEPIELLLLGDSLAAGLGADRRKDTLGGRLSKGLAGHLRVPVRLRTAAVVGSESSALSAQLRALPASYRPDVSVIVVGGNDVTHLISPDTATAHLERTILELREKNSAVVVGTCPDLGTLRPVPQPLRSLLSQLSRRMAAAQTRVSHRSGAVPVNLRRALGPSFRSSPNVLFSLDRFHPSGAGYRHTAEVLLPAIIEVLHEKQVQEEVSEARIDKADYAVR